MLHNLRLSVSTVVILFSIHVSIRPFIQEGFAAEISAEISTEISATPATMKSACQSHHYFLHQVYDAESHSPLRLSYNPKINELCWQLLASGQTHQYHALTLPEPFHTLDAAITAGQQIVVAGRNREGESFLQALDKTGQLLWRYPFQKNPFQKNLSQKTPSPNDDAGQTLRFYDLAVDEKKTTLFVAGARNHHGILLVIDLNGSSVNHAEEVFYEPDGSLSESSYRQVIAGTEKEAIVVRYSEQDSQPTTLEKWYSQNDQWLLNADFCPECSLTSVASVALKAGQSKDDFFYIASTRSQLYFSRVNTVTGDILNTVVLDTGLNNSLNWTASSRIMTPALLSASTAISTSEAFGDDHQEITDCLFHMVRGLAENPTLVLMNRGCLLGISSTVNRNTPLVVDLCPKASQIVHRSADSAPASTDNTQSLLTFWTIANSILAASGVLGITTICLKTASYLRTISRKRAASPEEADPQKEPRKKRMEYLTRHARLTRSQLHPEEEKKRPTLQGDTLVPVHPALRQQDKEWTDQSREISLQLLQRALAPLIKTGQESAVKIGPSCAITQRLLSEALTRVMPQRPVNTSSPQHKPLPDSLTLVPMPADQYCFYHAIGQAVNVNASGPELFHSITTLAQTLLQDFPELSAVLNQLTGGEGALEEMAAMTYVDSADQQIWGHWELLPFICWHLELPVVAVTPGTWQEEAGALLIMPDGQWNMLNGDEASMLTQMEELHNSMPTLLIMQHDGHNHWDVLIHTPKQPPELNQDDTPE